MTAFRSNTGEWQGSCPWDGYNTGRGGREFRGDRRGKNGRSLRGAVAPFFFVLLSAPAADAAAQRTELFVALSGAVSTDLVRDDVASPALRQLLGGVVDREVRARSAAGPVAAVGVRVPLRRRTTLEIEGSWSPTELRAVEDGRTRTIQDLHVVQALAGVSWHARGPLQLGAAAGMTTYLADETGMFAEGTDAGPALRGHAAVRLPFWSERITARAAAQLHRFGTPAMRRIRGTDGLVTRLEIGVRVRLVELGR